MFPLNFMKQFSQRFGPKFWYHYGSAVIAGRPCGLPLSIDIPRSGKRWYFGFLLALTLLLPCVIALLLFLNVAIPPEILVPLLMSFVVLLLLSSKTRFLPGSRIRQGSTSILLVVALLVLPAFYLPLMLRDVGSIYTTLSMLVPAILILLASRPLRIGITALLTVFVIVIVAFLTLRYVDIGRAGVRFFVFDKELTARRVVFFHPVIQAKGNRAIGYTSLRDALEHTTENSILAHQGSRHGKGYGHGPAEKTRIRLDTIRFNSVYSFYVVSEFGGIGGISLMILYALPAFAVLLSGVRRFDIGYAFASVIAASFFVEANSHAMMNLGALPFTGRNLPLLSVYSSSDLLRWMILWIFAHQAVFWRTTGYGKMYSTSSYSLVSPPSELEKIGRETSHYVWNSTTTVFLIGLLTSMLGITMIRNLQNERLSRPVDWTPALDEIQVLIDQGELTLDQKTLEIQISKHLQAEGRRFLEQEILRFNSLSRLEKVEGLRGKETTTFSERLKTLRTIDQYDRLMDEYRSGTRAQERKSQLLLFELKPPVIWADQDQEIRIRNPQFGLSVNRAFNSRISFHEPEKMEDIPVIGMREGSSPAFILFGKSFRIVFKDRAAQNNATGRIVLKADEDGTLQEIEEINSASAQSEVFLDFLPFHQTTMRLESLGVFRIKNGQLLFRRSSLFLNLRRGTGQLQRVTSAETTIHPGDSLEVPGEIGNNLQPVFHFTRTRSDAVIGPAWVMGKWKLASDSSSPVPWLPYLVSALEDSSESFDLSLDSQMQGRAQQFVQRKARNHFHNLLATRPVKDVLPPRRGS